MTRRESITCDPDQVADLVRSQDDGAMDRIVQCYLDDLLGVGRCACRNPDRAPDAVHDALVSAMERLAQFRGDGSVKAWLSRMVVNACRCQERGRKNDPRWNRPLEDDRVEGGTTPDELAARAELVDRLARALGGLSEADRTLLLLSQVGDATAPELAEALSISPEAVRARLTRLRRRLRAELDDVWRAWDP